MRSAFQIWAITSDTFRGGLFYDVNDAQEFLPVMSPDGARIAFVSTRPGNLEIYVMNVDRSGLARLTAQPGEDFDPAWSPDSRRIVFSSDRDGWSELYAVGADGTGLTRLTTSPGEDWSASWSPDGARLRPIVRVIALGRGSASSRS
jgi:TolB protein